MELPTVGVITVATNRYVDYWMQLARSADIHFFPGHEVTLHVFTDQVSEINAFISTLSRVHVNVIGIPPLLWPEATLLRYELMDSHRNQLSQNILVHLDADMQLVSDLGNELDPSKWVNGICLVRHPGYRRPGGINRAKLYFKHPGISLRDIYSIIKFGGIGRWETDPNSAAFVSRSKRGTYVCGGTWFGLHEEFLSMVHLLATNTRRDLDNGIIAVWHDESHLNSYFAVTETSLLDSDYCFADKFPSLAGVSPRILAVEKNDDRTR